MISMSIDFYRSQFIKRLFTLFFMYNDELQEETLVQWVLSTNKWFNDLIVKFEDFAGCYELYRFGQQQNSPLCSLCAIINHLKAELKQHIKSEQEINDEMASKKIDSFIIFNFKRLILSLSIVTNILNISPVSNKNNAPKILKLYYEMESIVNNSTIEKINNYIKNAKKATTENGQLNIVNDTEITIKQKIQEVESNINDFFNIYRKTPKSKIEEVLDNISISTGSLFRKRLPNESLTTNIVKRIEKAKSMPNL
jgi:hypothetical protein